MKKIDIYSKSGIQYPVPGWLSANLIPDFHLYGQIVDRKEILAIVNNKTRARLELFIIITLVEADNKMAEK